MNKARIILFESGMPVWDLANSTWAGNNDAFYDQYAKHLPPDSALWGIAQAMFSGEWSPSPDMQVDSVMICAGDVDAFLDALPGMVGTFDMIFVGGEEIGGPVTTRIHDFFLHSGARPVPEKKPEPRRAFCVLQGGKGKEYIN